MTEDRYPLSLAQERMWFHDRLDPDSTRYNSPVLLRLRGPIDVRRLRAAVVNVARAHEQLRARFVAPDGIPMQEVVADAEPSLEVREPAEGTTLEEALPEIRAQSRQRFSLADDLPVSATLWTLGRDEAVLAITFHHLVVDAESIRLVLSELGARYADPAAEPSLPLASYRDYVLEERERAASDRVREAVERRAEQLADVPALDLPTPAHPPEDGVADRSRVEPFAGDLTDAVGTEARRLRLTPFMLLVAALTLQLSARTGQERFLLATLVSRRRRRHRGVVGFFVDTDVLVADVSDAATLAEACDRTRDEILRGLAGPPVPLQALVERMRRLGARDWPSRLRALVSFEGHATGLSWGDLEVTRLSDAVYTEPVFDCELGWWDSGTGLGMTAMHDPRAVDSAVIDEVVEAHPAVLSRLLAAPDRPLAGCRSQGA